MFPKIISVEEDEGNNVSLVNNKEVVFNFETKEHEIIDGKFINCSYIEKIKQYVNLVLRTEKGKYEIYDEDFGLSIYKYIGRKNINEGFLKSELKREIEENLKRLKEIEDIVSFETKVSRRDFIIKFSLIIKGERVNINEEIAI